MASAMEEQAAARTGGVALVANDGLANNANRGGGGGCGPPPELVPDVDSGDKQEMTFGQFMMSIGALLLALPALVGACCWPMVIAAILNVGATFMNSGAGSGVVDFFHGFQVAIMMTIMLNLTQFTWWTCKQRRSHLGSFWQIQLPTLLVLFASILVNIQPIAILVIGSWKLCCAECHTMGVSPEQCPASGYTYPPWGASGEARPCSAPGGNLFWDKSYCTGGKYPVFPTVASGWAIQILCTWVGFVFMFAGVLQATQLHVKIRNKWRTLRRGRPAAPQA